MASALARLRASDPRVADWALAVAFVVAGIVEMTFYADGANDLAAGVVVSLVLLTLAVRRRYPLVPAIAIPVTLIFASIPAPFVVTTLSAGYIAAMVAFYSLARYRSRSVLPALLAGLLAILVADTIADGIDHGELFWLGLLAIGPYMIGRAMRNRTRLQAELRARTDEIERDREQRASRAVEDERARIATELQAVIANGLSAMVVQAEVVPRAVAAGDTRGAADVLGAIEATGRESLAETRRLLGVLRPAEDRPSLVPQPTLASLEGLAERIRAGGLAVELAYEGEPVALAPGPDLAAYRVVQESLEAAAANGADSASVAVRFWPDSVEVDVSDDRAGPGAEGDSLAQLRDRLGLYGGRIRVDRGDGEFRVLARLPVNGAAA